MLIIIATFFCILHHLLPAAIGWDLVNRRVVEVINDTNVAICCNCRVVNKLWLGAGGSCHILNLQTLKLEVNAMLILLLLSDSY